MANELTDSQIERQAAAGRRVGLMNDERVPVLRLPAKEPRITIRAAVEFSPF